MSTLTHTNRSRNAQDPIFAMNGPDLPTYKKQPVHEKKISDPSSAQPKGLSYPIPSFFEYRAKPKEHDVL